MSLQFELDWNQKLPPSAQLGMAVEDESRAALERRWVHFGRRAKMARLLPTTF